MSPTSSISSWNNSSLWLLSWCCLTLRVALALLCRTAYHPDEYYQHSEVAYSIAFPNKVNNSDMMSSTWTWEWHEAYRIRSFVGLLPVVLAYKSAHVLSVPVQYWHYLPRLLQAILNTIGDVHFYQLARLCFDSKYAKIALFVHLTSWSSLYMTTRTLSNGTEAQLFIIAVYYLFTRNQRLWMTQQPYRSGHLFHLHIALCLMVISFWIRPTIVLIWAPLVIILLREDFFHWSSKQLYFNLSFVSFVVQCCVLVDSYLYQRWTCTPLQFFTANVYHNLAAYFGITPWYFNFTQALPVVLGLYLPYLIYGMSIEGIPRKIRLLASIVLAYILGLSFLSAHHEHRFLVACLPPLHLLVAWVVYRHYVSKGYIAPGRCRNVHLSNVERTTPSKKPATTSANPSTSDTASNQSPKRRARREKLFKRILFSSVTFALVTLTHISAAWYLLRYHQAGTEVAFNYIREDLSIKKEEDARGAYVILAAPCFTFPTYSYLASTTDDPIHIYSMPCPAPWEHKEKFDEDPDKHLQELLRSAKSSLDSRNVHWKYVATFDAYEALLNTTLSSNHFVKVAEFHHAHVRYDYDDPFPKFKAVVYRQLED